ncbi:unnamed protein product [Heterosigma akashiwo]
MKTALISSGKTRVVVLFSIICLLALTNLSKVNARAVPKELTQLAERKNQEGSLRRPHVVDISFRGGASKAKLKGNAVAKQPADRVSQKIGILVPTLVAMNYFFSLSLVIPVLPKVVNSVVSGEEVTSRFGLAMRDRLGHRHAVHVPDGQRHGSLSDKFGGGLHGPGLAWPGSRIPHQQSGPERVDADGGSLLDGCTSCMYAIANAYVVDVAAPSGRLVQASAPSGHCPGRIFHVWSSSGWSTGNEERHQVPLSWCSRFYAPLNAVYCSFCSGACFKEARQRKEGEPGGLQPLGRGAHAGPPLLALARPLPTSSCGSPTPPCNQLDQLHPGAVRGGVAQSGSACASWACWWGGAQAADPRPGDQAVHNIGNLSTCFSKFSACICQTGVDGLRWNCVARGWLHCIPCPAGISI